MTADAGACNGSGEASAKKPELEPDREKPVAATGIEVEEKDGDEIGGSIVATDATDPEPKVDPLIVEETEATQLNARALVDEEEGSGDHKESGGGSEIGVANGHHNVVVEMIVETVQDSGGDEVGIASTSYHVVERNIGIVEVGIASTNDHVVERSVGIVEGGGADHEETGEEEVGVVSINGHVLDDSVDDTVEKVDEGGDGDGGVAVVPAESEETTAAENDEEGVLSEEAEEEMVAKDEVQSPALVVAVEEEMQSSAPAVAAEEDVQLSPPVAADETQSSVPIMTGEEESTTELQERIVPAESEETTAAENDEEGVLNEEAEEKMVAEEEVQSSSLVVAVEEEVQSSTGVVAIEEEVQSSAPVVAVEEEVRSSAPIAADDTQSLVPVMTGEEESTTELEERIAKNDEEGVHQEELGERKEDRELVVGSGEEVSKMPLVRSHGDEEGKMRDVDFGSVIGAELDVPELGHESNLLDDNAAAEMEREVEVGTEEPKCQQDLKSVLDAEDKATEPVESVDEARLEASVDAANEVAQSIPIAVKVDELSSVSPSSIDVVEIAVLSNNNEEVLEDHKKSSCCDDGSLGNEATSRVENVCALDEAKHLTTQEMEFCEAIVESDKENSHNNAYLPDLEESTTGEGSIHDGGDIVNIDGNEPIIKDDDEPMFHNKTEVGDEIQSTTEDGRGLNLELGKRRHSAYIVKVTRFSNDELWAKIEDAQQTLDEKTRSRDSIGELWRNQREVCSGLWDKLGAAKQLYTEARHFHNDKKRELHHVQSVISKINKANSIDDMDEMIKMKEKSMQHETMSLKEEKLLLQEIKELKSQRKQLWSDMGSQAEIREAFHQREHIDEQLKVLRKDLDFLFKNMKKEEEKVILAQKNFDDEDEKCRKLNEQYKAANEVRQKVYGHWRSLKNESIKKSKYFFMYKDDQKAVLKYKSSGDTEGLWHYCDEQMEKFLEIWNKDDDFRKQYVEANKYSTLRRLGTLDGRRLGPNEDPPRLFSNLNRRASKPQLPDSNFQVPTVASEVKLEKYTPPTSPAEEDSFPILQAPQTGQCAKPKVSGKISQKETNVTSLANGEDLDLIEKERARKIEEELELARKAEELTRREEEEELRKEKAAAEKEQLRLEQKAKAKEAEERKKRQAEKAQERAEYKARKEAEMKEKKKAKKDKKKGATGDAANGTGESSGVDTPAMDVDSGTAVVTRGANISESAAPKRPRPALAMKQLNRVQPLPAPLRNKGKRKWRSWVMAAAAALLVLALFMAGNHVSFSFSSTKFQI